MSSRLLCKAGRKHADETSWRNDGQNEYAWLFATPELSIFRFRKSRSARVVKEVFDEESLPGILVVDRYQAYKSVPCAMQYCCAHLLRNIQDLEKEFPENKEVKRFGSTAAPLLAGAKTREVLMTVLYTLKRKTHSDPLTQLKTFLDAYSQDRNRSPTEIIFQ